MENRLDVGVSQFIYRFMSSSSSRQQFYVFVYEISSEQPKGIEIVEEGLLDCGATGKFIDQNYA